MKNIKSLDNQIRKHQEKIGDLESLKLCILIYKELIAQMKYMINSNPHWDNYSTYYINYGIYEYDYKLQEKYLPVVGVTASKSNGFIEISLEHQISISNVNSNNIPENLDINVLQKFLNELNIVLAVVKNGPWDSDIGETYLLRAFIVTNQEELEALREMKIYKLPSKREDDKLIIPDGIYYDDDSILEPFDFSVIKKTVAEEKIDKNIQSIINKIKKDNEKAAKKRGTRQ